MHCQIGHRLGALPSAKHDKKMKVKDDVCVSTLTNFMAQLCFHLQNGDFGKTRLIVMDKRMHLKCKSSFVFVKPDTVFFFYLPSFLFLTKTVKIKFDDLTNYFSTKSHKTLSLLELIIGHHVYFGGSCRIVW